MIEINLILKRFFKKKFGLLNSKLIFDPFFYSKILLKYKSATMQNSNIMHPIKPHNTPNKNYLSTRYKIPINKLIIKTNIPKMNLKFSILSNIFFKNLKKNIFVFI